MPFLTLTQVVIEDHTVEIIERELVDEFYQDSNNTVEFLENLSQPDKEQMLQRFGVLSGDLVGQMAHVRQVRNDLVHDLRSDEYFRIVRDSADILESCSRLLSEFESETPHNRGFSWS